jgi:hypothetical protein
MEKQIIDKFIRKYNLGGSIESVKWTINSESKVLGVSAKSEDRNTIVYVELSPFEGIGESCEFGVYDTKKLKQLTGNFDTQFDVEVNKKDNEVRSLKFSDANTEVLFVASSLAVVSSTPAPKDLPPFEVEVVFDEHLSKWFNKAKSSLNSVSTFTLVNDKKGNMNLVLGYSTNNTDRITRVVPTTEGKNVLQQPLHFQANVLKEILSANEECDQAILKVSERGLANITFDKDGYKSNYFMVAVPDID